MKNRNRPSGKKLRPAVTALAFQQIGRLRDGAIVGLDAVERSDDAADEDCSIDAPCAPGEGARWPACARGRWRDRFVSTRHPR